MKSIFKYEELVADGYVWTDIETDLWYHNVGCELRLQWVSIRVPYEPPMWLDRVQQTRPREGWMAPAWLAALAAVNASDAQVRACEASEPLRRAVEAAYRLGGAEAVLQALQLAG